MFDDDFFAKTSEALNGFFDSIEKSIKGLQKEVDSAKDKMKESAEKAKAENENVFKGDDVKEEPAKTEAKAEDKTEAKNETADEGKKDGEAAAKKPFEDWFNKAKDAVSGIKIGGAPKVIGIPYYRADTADTVNIFCELPGCDRSNVKLNYEKDSILITAKKEAPTVEGTVLFTENTGFVGKMDLKVRVGNLDAKSIHASYKDGVLRITAKRPQENSASGIKID
ncbi:MAG: Hsp20 family protein [Lachnospiraceae bacterium]|nr:Hsp20 family protein [Lachnospiraceae bacterium]